MRVLFISDCHLCESRPLTTTCFKHFLSTEASRADALYILGDLFHYWIGDDDDGAFYTDICQHLKALSTKIPIHFLPGNHDFMVRRGFEQRTGCQILPDEHVIKCDGQSILLMHGDLLCSDDRLYQIYRRCIQSPITYWCVMRIHLSKRQRIAQYLLDRSRTGNQKKSPHIMDVNQETVISTMRKHQVNCLIHGHTHRRAEHAIQSEGEPFGKRIVLGNWGETGNALAVDNGVTSWLDISA